MRNKQAHVQIYYVQCSLLHVSTTYSGHLQGGVLWRNIT